jgi:hypothetical protein
MMLTLRTVFLSLHAASGVLGLIIGIYAIKFRAARIYAASLVSLVAFLTATVAVDWSIIDATQRLVYTALIGLAIVIVVRIFLALRVATRHPAGWKEKYLNHVYFTYISLWDGFFIVGLIDLGAPGWLVGGVAVGVLIVGAVLFSNYKRRTLGAARPEMA